MGLIDQKSRMMRAMLDGLLPYVRDPREAAKITRAQAEASLDAAVIKVNTARGTFTLERPDDLQKIQGHTIMHVWLEEACALDNHDFWSRGAQNGFGGGGHDHRIDAWGYGAGGVNVPPPVPGGGGAGFAPPSPEAEMARTEMVMHLEGMIAHTRARQRSRWSRLWQSMESLFAHANAQDRMAVSLTEMLEHAYQAGIAEEREAQTRAKRIREEADAQEVRAGIDRIKQETVNRLSTVARSPHER